MNLLKEFLKGKKKTNIIANDLDEDEDVSCLKTNHRM
jgi:hypothetical protein